MVLSSAIVCDHDRRIADDRRSSFHMIADDCRPYCDLRSAICDPRSYGNQPLDRTWFYLLRSSAITIAGSQTIADLIAICDHMETSLKYTNIHIYKGICKTRTGWLRMADADGGWRMGKCGWKNADDKIK